MDDSDRRKPRQGDEPRVEETRDTRSRERAPRERGADKGAGKGGGGMGMRGVSRPMAERAMREHGSMQSPEHESGEHGGEQQDGHGSHHGHDGHGGHGMSDEQRQQMLRMHHRQTLWCYWAVVLLGLWQIAAPFALGWAPGSGVEVAAPSGGRDLWITDEARVLLTTWSDVLSGLLLVVFGWRGLQPNRPVSLWVCCFVGIWLTIAPLLLWSPTPAAYLNDSLVGMLVIALTVLIPGMPNMIAYMRMGPPTPPGWSYNPSSWAQRSVMIGLGFIGWLVSRQLGAFQLGFTSIAWDPFFGDGTRQVLNSEMSHMWPVSDAALGAFAYTFEFLMGWMGSESRWRTMPWMVAFFGILVIPLGLVHIALVISQPLVVGAWCTLCLLAALIMLPMIPLEVDEVIAMGQNLVAAKRKGESVWRAFWKGGPAEASTMDERTPPIHEFPTRTGAVVRASLWGLSVPWTLAASTALGVALMFVPGVLGQSGWAANVFHLCGSLVVVTAVIAMGEPLRLVRWLDVPLGLAVMVLPWLLDGGTTLGGVAGVVIGVLVVALAVPRGPKRETYGSWDRFVW